VSDCFRRTLVRLKPVLQISGREPCWFQTNSREVEAGRVRESGVHLAEFQTNSREVEAETPAVFGTGGHSFQTNSREVEARSVISRTVLLGGFRRTLVRLKRTPHWGLCRRKGVSDELS